jgi:hypothetical protein
VYWVTFGAANLISTLAKNLTPNDTAFTLNCPLSIVDRLRCYGSTRGTGFLPGFVLRS